jgi:hypothetical protein
MPPSPYKRNRRMKSRLTAGSDDDRVNLRTKAVEMMTGGRKAPDPVAHAEVPGRDNSSRSFPRPTQPSTGPKSSLGKARIRLMPESGGTHNRAAPQTAVKNDTLDKGARRPVAKRPASAYDNQLSSLARQRALSGNRNNKGRRNLFARRRKATA